MASREKQHKRVLKYFIQAAQSIIQEEGMEAVTIRKLANIAGFNSATLYNYFQDLDQLLLYASLNYLTSYNKKIIQKSYRGKSWYDILLLTWEEFSDISFKYPEAFLQIFFNKHSDALPSICNSYYDLFSEEKVSDTNEWHSILADFNLSNRNKAILCKMYPNNEISRQDLEIVNELMISAYRLLLEKRISYKKEYSQQFCQQKMMINIRYLISTLQLKKEGVFDEQIKNQL